MKGCCWFGGLMFSRSVRRRLVVLAAVATLVPVGASVPAAAAPAGPLAPLSASLAATLGAAADALPMTALIHGTDVATARNAATAAGLTEVTSFRRIGVVAVSGTAAQLRAARAQAGVTYVE